MLTVPSRTSFGMFGAALDAAADVSPSHPILGRWRLELFGGECIETIDFRPDGIRAVTAGAQKLRATFTISATPDEVGFYVLTDKIVSTNGEPDCAGRKPPVGDEATGYVTFNDRKDRLQACNAKDLTTCWGPYLRDGINAELPIQRSTWQRLSAGFPASLQR